jgi:Mg2+/Co2+ transporter CorC
MVAETSMRPMRSAKSFVVDETGLVAGVTTVDALMLNIVSDFEGGAKEK